MVTVYVFNTDTGRQEKYAKLTGDPMPYNVGGTLTVAQFLAGENSPVIWTDTQTMQAFNALCALTASPVTVRRGFLLRESTAYNTRFHNAGVAFLLSSASLGTPTLLEAAKQVEQFTVVQQDGAFVYADCRLWLAAALF